MEILSPAHVYRFLLRKIDSECEEFWAIALAPNKSVINYRLLFRGTVDSCMVHPRDVFRFACLANASGIIVAHNHPSGDVLPSKDDLEITEQLKQASLLLQIPLFDHVIITNREYNGLISGVRGVGANLLLPR